MKREAVQVDPAAFDQLIVNSPVDIVCAECHQLLVKFTKKCSGASFQKGTLKVFCKCRSTKVKTIAR